MVTSNIDKAIACLRLESHPSLYEFGPVPLGTFTSGLNRRPTDDHLTRLYIPRPYGEFFIDYGDAKQAMSGFARAHKVIYAASNESVYDDLKAWYEAE